MRAFMDDYAGRLLDEDDPLKRAQLCIFIARECRNASDGARRAIEHEKTLLRNVASYEVAREGRYERGTTQFSASVSARVDQILDKEKLGRGRNFWAAVDNQQMYDRWAQVYASQAVMEMNVYQLSLEGIPRVVAPKQRSGK